MLLRSTLILAVFSFVLAGCAATIIPNTDVEDTRENRDVIEFCEQYRHAMEERDIPALLALASPSYYDDNGTLAGTDDVDFDGLRAKLDDWQDKVLAVRYEIRYRKITFRNNKIFVELTYTGSFRVKEGERDRWSRRLADHRIVIMRDTNQKFKIVSGM